MENGIQPSGLKEKILLFLGLRQRFRVEGESMTPLLQSRDRILIKKTKRFNSGDIVVSKHPIQSDVVIVKKIESIDSHGRLKLIGINQSQSSHRFGLVNKKYVLGKVTSIFKDR